MTTLKKKITKTDKTIEEPNEKTKPMEELLKKAKEQPKAPKTGDLLEGEVIEVGGNALYLNIGPTKTGIIIGTELHDGLGTFEKLKIGEKISAKVIDPENENGYVELSLREASFEKVWEKLNELMKSGEIITTKIKEANRGGIIAEIMGVKGFLPVSQLSTAHYPRVEDGDKNKILGILQKYINQNFNVKVIDVNKEEEKLIISERATEAEQELAKISNLKTGDAVEGEISGVVDFGAFIKFNGLEGLVHISELAWQLIENPRDIIRVGQKVKAKIIGIDGNRISLSIKALKEDPWEKISEKYKVGDKIKGEITKINPFGAFVQLDKDIHGLVHISEINKTKKELEAGKSYEFAIISIESKEHRLGLSPL